MLLDLWPLFIATQAPLPPPSGGGVTARVVKQVKAEAKHVKLHINTWQEQETFGYIGIKYELFVQQHVALFGNTGQQQGIDGVITSTKPTDVAQKASNEVSTHYRLNVATEQVQVSRGTISTSNTIVDAPSENKVIVHAQASSIGNISTAQTQHIVGKIISNPPVAEVESVSTHYQINSSTAQTQEISCRISTVNYQVPQIALGQISTYQKQAISGKIVTNGDDEMLMVLMALLELDSDVG